MNNMGNSQEKRLWTTFKILTEREELAVSSGKRQTTLASHSNVLGAFPPSFFMSLTSGMASHFVFWVSSRTPLLNTTKRECKWLKVPAAVLLPSGRVKVLWKGDFVYRTRNYWQQEVAKRPYWLQCSWTYYLVK